MSSIGFNTYIYIVGYFALFSGLPSIHTYIKDFSSHLQRTEIEFLSYVASIEALTFPHTTTQMR